MLKAIVLGFIPDFLNQKPGCRPSNTCLNKTSSRLKYSHIQTTRAFSCLEFLRSVFQYYNWRQRLIQTKKAEVLFKSWERLWYSFKKELFTQLQAEQLADKPAMPLVSCVFTDNRLQQVNVESFLGPGHFSPGDSPLMATPQELAIGSDQEHLCQTRTEV